MPSSKFSCCKNDNKKGIIFWPRYEFFIDCLALKNGWKPTIKTRFTCRPIQLWKTLVGSKSRRQDNLIFDTLISPIYECSTRWYWYTLSQHWLTSFHYFLRGIEFFCLCLSSSSVFIARIRVIKRTSSVDSPIFALKRWIWSAALGFSRYICSWCQVLQGCTTIKCRWNRWLLQQRWIMTWKN